MPTANLAWAITFGDYAFTINRKTLAYDLTETKTGTVWAENLPVGWIEIEDVLTGGVSRYDFGQARLLSLSEKAGAQGKRILFGLDLHGIPIDLYFTCAQTEIQFTVEASRDTRTHRVQEVCLLPGLCSVPPGADAASYLVVPHREGALARAADAPDTPVFLPVWDFENGLTMPFVGAVRASDGETNTSALGLLTDSAYGVAALARQEDGSAALDWHYRRDPERRRLDMRVVVLPGGDSIAIARAYRDKVIGERNHVLLRRKAREHPYLGDNLLGGALVVLDGKGLAAGVTSALQREELGVERFVVLAPENRAATVLTGIADAPLRENERASEWDDMDRRMDTLRQAAEAFALVGASGGCDWSSIGLDFWQGLLAGDEKPRFGTAFLPLYAAVYHDSVAAPSAPLHPAHPRRFLRALLNLSPPAYQVASPEMLYPTSDRGQYLRATYAVLGPLHRLCFPAFVTAHRFLTPDFAVEEARYSNGARVVINQSDTNAYESENLALPPLGFFAEHSQMTAHDALRVGEEAFAPPQRAWRIARSRDEKPLSESADILRRAFPV